MVIGLTTFGDTDCDVVVVVDVVVVDVVVDVVVVTQAHLL